METRKYMTIVTGSILLVVAGCGSTQYQFMGATYTDSQKWLAAQRTFYDEELKKVPTIPKPVAGRALVILPGRGLIMQVVKEQEYENVRLRYGYDMSKNPRNLSVRIPEESFQASEIEWDYRASIFRKRGLFESVETQRSDRPEDLPGGDYDVILYISSNLEQWFMKMKDQTEPVPLYFDKSKPDQRLDLLEYTEMVLTKKRAGTK